MGNLEIARMLIAREGIDLGIKVMRGLAHVCVYYISQPNFFFLLRIGKDWMRSSSSTALYQIHFQKNRYVK